MEEKEPYSGTVKPKYPDLANWEDKSVVPEPEAIFRPGNADRKPDAPNQRGWPDG